MLAKLQTILLKIFVLSRLEQLFTTLVTSKKPVLLSVVGLLTVPSVLQVVMANAEVAASTEVEISENVRKKQRKMDRNFFMRLSFPSPLWSGRGEGVAIYCNLSLFTLYNLYCGFCYNCILPSPVCFTLPILKLEGFKVAAFIVSSPSIT